ncbi:MAG: hypothetical protein AAF548_05140 [Actinomycetota bacterium]
MLLPGFFDGADPVTSSDDGVPQVGDPTPPAADPDETAQNPPVESESDDAPGLTDDPVIVDVTPDGADDGGGPVIWIVLGVIVVLGVTIVIAVRVYPGGRNAKPVDDDSPPSDDEVDHEPPPLPPLPPVPGMDGDEPAAGGDGDSGDDGESGDDLPSVDTGGTRVRGTVKPPPGETEVPIPPSDPPYCDWELYFNDGAAVTKLRSAAPGDEVCCTYVVTITSKVDESVRAAMLPQDVPPGREHVPAQDLSIEGTVFDVGVLTRSSPDDSPAGDVSAVAPSGSAPDWLELPDSYQGRMLTSSILHDESTTVDVTVHSRCKDAVSSFDSDYENRVLREASFECADRDGQPEPAVDLHLGVDLLAVGSGDVVGRSASALPPSAPDHDRERPDQTSGDSEHEAKADHQKVSNAFAWNGVFRSTATLGVAQFVPEDVWASTDRVVAMTAGTVEHTLTLGAKVTSASDFCVIEGTAYRRRSEPKFDLAILTTGNELRTDDQDWSLERIKLEDASGAGSWKATAI